MQRIVLGLLLLVSCVRHDTIKFEIPEDYTLIFESNERNLRLSGNPTDNTLVLISNFNLNDPILTCKGCSFSVATSADSTLDHFRYYFKPVNNRELFMKTGISGDLNSSYTVTQDDSTYEFQLSKSAWNDYRVNFSIENKIVDFKLKFDVHSQADHQQKNGLSSSVHLSESELSVAGVNLIFNSYALRDTLSIRIRIVNHGLSELIIKPELIDPNSTNIHILRKGERKSLSFQIPFDNTSFTIPSTTFLIRNTPLLKSHIELKPNISNETATVL